MFDEVQANCLVSLRLKTTFEKKDPLLTNSTLTAPMMGEFGTVTFYNIAEIDFDRGSMIVASNDFIDIDYIPKDIWITINKADGDYAHEHRLAFSKNLGFSLEPRIAEDKFGLLHGAIRKTLATFILETLPDLYRPQIIDAIVSALLQTDFSMGKNVVAVNGYAPLELGKPLGSKAADQLELVYHRCVIGTQPNISVELENVGTVISSFTEVSAQYVDDDEWFGFLMKEN